MTLRTARILALSSIAALLLPTIASAHERQEFLINGKRYAFTVGSIGEPVIVDDKSGVEVTVSVQDGEPATAHPHDDGDGDDDGPAGSPVTGLETNLKVEVSAGGKSKTFALTPAWGEPGAYRAVFFPTVATTLTYRFVGTVDGVVVDLPFACNPAGHPQTPDDASEAEMGTGVTRVRKAGAFGCPQPKADLGFPEPSATVAELHARDKDMSSNGIAMIALVLGAVGCGLGLATHRRQRL
jgi:hypothetical protein